MSEYMAAQMDLDDSMIATRLEEKFFSLAKSSEAAIEDFNDFADDLAIAWAAREIKHLREKVKELEK